MKHGYIQTIFIGVQTDDQMIYYLFLNTTFANSSKCIFHGTSPIHCFVHTDDRQSSPTPPFNSNLDIYQIKKGSIPLQVQPVIYVIYSGTTHTKGLISSWLSVRLSGFIFGLDCLALIPLLGSIELYGTIYKLRTLQIGFAIYLQ